MLHKTTTRAEADVYVALGETPVKKFLPVLKSVKESTGRRVIMELQAPPVPSPLRRVTRHHAPPSAPPPRPPRARQPPHRPFRRSQDLTHCVADACLMDVKMGARTFTEEDAKIPDVRADLLQKMQKARRDESPRSIAGIKRRDARRDAPPKTPRPARTRGR